MRHSLSRSGSRQYFSRNSHPHPRNYAPMPMRGGIRA